MSAPAAKGRASTAAGALRLMILPTAPSPPPGKQCMPATAVFLPRHRFKGDQVEIAMPDIAHTLHETETGRSRAHE